MLCLHSSILGQNTYQNVNLREITFSDSIVITQTNSGTTDIIKIDETQFAMTRNDWGFTPYDNDDVGIVVLGSIIDSTINFSGYNSYYEPSIYYGPSSRGRIGSLDTNSLVLAFRGIFGSPNAYYGALSAVLAEIVGDSLSFGENFIFHLGLASYMDICVLDSEQFIVTYSIGTSPHFNDTVYACLGTIVGDSIQFSSPALVNDSGVTSLSICSLDSSKFIIGYIDLDSYDGLTRVGSIINDSISLGQKQCFSTTSIYELTTTAINDSSIFLFRREMFDSVRGTVAVINENELTFGNSSAFKSFGVYGTTASKIDNNHVVVEYSYWPWPDDRIGKTRIAAINNTKVTFGEEYDCCYGCMHGTDVIGMNDSEFVFTYNGTGGMGVSKIGYISPYPVLTLADSSSSCAGFHSVPVTEIDLKNINKLSLILEYDTLNLSYFSVQNLNSQLLVDSLSVTQSDGVINLTYCSDIPLNLNDDILLELVFNIDTVLIPSTEVLAWNEELSFFINNKGDTIGKRFENGYINVLPAIGEVGPITGQDSICQGIISASYYIESILNADSYIWNLEPNIADSVIVFDTVVTIYYQPENVTPSTLTVYGGNDCVNSDTSNLSIDIITNPVSISGSDTSICENTSCTLNGVAYNYDHVYWASMGDGTFNDPFLLQSTYTPGNEDIINGNVSLILFAYAISPCLGEVGDTIVLSIIEISNQPNTPQGPSVIILDTCSNTEYFTDTIENANSYQWYLDPPDAGIITGIGTNAIVNWNNSYTGIVAYIYVQAINNCGETFSDSLVVDISPVGLFNKDSAYDVTVSPNPSNGIYNITIKGLEGYAELFVSNTSGKLIIYETLNIAKKEYKYPIDLRDVPSGIYYMRIVFEKQKHFDNTIILRKE